MLADLVPPQDPTDLATELGCAQRLAGAPRRLARDPLQPRLGGFEQRLALARTLTGQQRVVARHQALARVGIAHELAQPLRVEQ